MRKLGIISLALITLAIAPCAVAQKQQSIADAARENKKQKQESIRTVWTNDNIATVSKGLANEGAAPTDAPSAEAADSKQAEEAKQPCDKTKDEKCEADAKAASADGGNKGDDLKKKLDDMEKALADKTHEASLNEREWQLAQAAYYGDAGTQLRNPKKFADDQAAHKKDADQLQKSIDDLQKQIDALKEQARKDGVKV
jgi:cell division protein FtsB